MKPNLKSAIVKKSRETMNEELDDKSIDMLIKQSEQELKKPERKKRKRKGYFDNEEMLNLFREKQELEAKTELDRTQTIRLRRLNDKIAEKYIQVADGMMKRPNFINYPPHQKDEMLSDAVFIMRRAGERYNIDYPNPFGYLSQITFNAFIQSLKNMKKRTENIVIVNHLENFDGFDEAFD